MALVSTHPPWLTTRHLLYLLIVILFFTLISCQQTGEEHNCPEPDQKGPNCTTCRCLNGLAACDPASGYCTADYQCAPGWTDPPYCQTPCSSVTWGVNCRELCHCLPGHNCFPINGVCNTSCDIQWTGASCQVRRARLTTAPEVENVTCVDLWLRWRAWSPVLDPGDLLVHTYTVEQQVNQSDWTVLDLISVPDPAAPDPFYEYRIPIDPYATYTFRIIANTEQYEKLVYGLPGPITPPIKPLHLCIVPTTPLPTTPPPTTTTQTTTVLPTTTTTTEPTTTTTEPTTTTETTTIMTTTTPPPTTPKPKPPNPVVDFRVILQDRLGVFRLSWQPPTNLSISLVSYNVTHQIVGIGDCNDTYREPVQSHILDPRLTSYELADLAPWRMYSVSLAAVNVAGQGNAQTFNLLSQQFQPTGAPESLSHTNLASTSVTFTWDEVPCADRGGSLVNYQTLVTDSVTLDFVTSARVGNKEQTVTGLIPYRSYTIRVRYVNQIGDGPYSEEYSVRTLQDAPPAPRNVQVLSVTQSSVFIYWNPPDPPHGVITHYRVIYTSTVDPGVENSVVQTADATQRNITNLLPFMRYTFQVQARTKAVANDGWGSRSAVVNGSTSDGIPGAPRNLVRTSRSETCISLQWEPPLVLNGVITNYKLTYTQMVLVSGEPPDPTPTVITLPATQRLYQACSLTPAAQYRFEVQASTRNDFGNAVSVDEWTEVAIPSMPPRPEVVDWDETTITLRIQPVVLNGGPVSGYFIVVEAIIPNGIRRRRRRKRATLDDPVSTIPLPGYTAAELGRSDVTRVTNIIVGDGQTYGSYVNKPLTRSTNYTIYYVVASSLDGTTKMSFSQIASPVLTVKRTTAAPSSSTTPSSAAPSTTTTTTTTTTTATTTQKPDPTSTAKTTEEARPSSREPNPTTTSEVSTGTAAPVSDDDDTTVIIIGVVLGILGLIILIILILLLIWCIRKDRKKNLPLDDQKNNTWLSYYTGHFLDKNSTKKGKWSDINNLNESRHPVFDPYSPDDIQVSDIHHNRPCISFKEEYQKLPQGLKFPCNAANMPKNDEMNRFDHILPYDHSRVHLRDKDTDYINANYIDGYDKRSAYIAVQSPFNECTMCDFWYMVYQERTTQVVFLARLIEDGIVKSEQYWPQQGHQQYGIINVHHVRTDEYANFIVRTFDLEIDGADLRRVTQYQFTAWPDHGVPDDTIPFLDFRMKVKTSENISSGAPMVVHCGTGVSKTAVFIAVDSLLEQAKVESAVNVYKFCSKMRRNRTMMVRTEKQYVFIYDALFEALITNYNIVGDDLKVNYRMLSNVNPVTDKSYFREQFETLEKFIDMPTTEKCAAGFREQNIKKNRFSTLNLLPIDQFRPLLHNHGPGQTDYINAIFLDSYLRKKTYIVTQTPLTETLGDFWRLVYEYNVNTIVMMNGSNFHEETCAQYWPSRVGMQRFDPFLVGLSSETDEDHFTVRKLKLTNTLQPNQPGREVRQFQFDSWNMYDKAPWSRDGLLEMMDRIETWRADTGSLDSPMVVHCMDGASQSGLFCAANVLCEKYRLEGEVDVFHTVKHMKLRRFHMLNTMEQYKFCFKLLWDYIHTRIKKSTHRSRLSLANGHVK